MAWAGVLVVVDTEEMSGGATAVWVRPAFDPEADLNERVPGGPHLLTPAERERLSRPVAAAGEKRSSVDSVVEAAEQAGLSY